MFDHSRQWTIEINKLHISKTKNRLRLVKILNKSPGTTVQTFPYCEKHKISKYEMSISMCITTFSKSYNECVIDKYS